MYLFKYICPNVFLKCICQIVFLKLYFSKWALAMTHTIPAHPHHHLWATQVLPWAPSMLLCCPYTWSASQLMAFYWTHQTLQSDLLHHTSYLSFFYTDTFWGLKILLPSSPWSLFKCVLKSCLPQNLRAQSTGIDAFVQVASQTCPTKHEGCFWSRCRPL